jgi:hypothetical protein
MSNRLAWIAGILYYAFGALASLFAGALQPIRLKVAAVGGGLIISGAAYYFQQERKFIQMRQETLEEFLEEFLLPNVVSAYRRQFTDADSPEFRANIMLYKRRHTFPFGKGRFMWPWKKSLKVDFSQGEYDDHGENNLIWAIDEGVCGTALEYNKPCWSDLEDIDIHEWGMTERQMKDTEHLGSVISIPIYRLNDETKDKPIGILNVDSRANLDETRFDEEEMREILLDYANYIGTLP